LLYHQFSGIQPRADGSTETAVVNTMTAQAKDLSKTAIARGRWRLVKLSVANMSLMSYLQKKAADRSYTLFNQGTYVWLPDEIEQFVPAKVVTTFERGSCGKVQRLDTEDIVDVRIYELVNY
jgi:hypothetical protein